MPEYDDDALERSRREGLEVRAGEARDRLEAAPGTGAPTRRRTTWLVGAAAVTLIVAAGVTAGLRHHTSPPGVAHGTFTGTVPSDWRYESFDGVQVRVPPNWGWGGAPMGSGDQVTLCGSPTAAVVPNIDGLRLDESSPYVGRPVMMSDACQAGEGARAWPAASAVWFGSPLPVGTDSTGDQVAETVAVGSQHVTVFAPDDTLRAEIVSTAERVATDGNGCPTAPVAAPAPRPEPDPSPRGLSVCVYDQDRLLWSASKDAAAAESYVGAFERATSLYDAATSCPLKPAEQWAAIGVAYADAPTRWDIADFSCRVIVGSYRVGRPEAARYEAPLVPPTVEPWAGGGVKAYVVGPGVTSADDPIASYFRGVMG